MQRNDMSAVTLAFEAMTLLDQAETLRDSVSSTPKDQRSERDAKVKTDIDILMHVTGQLETQCAATLGSYHEQLEEITAAEGRERTPMAMSDYAMVRGSLLMEQKRLEVAMQKVTAAMDVIDEIVLLMGWV